MMALADLKAIFYDFDGVFTDNTVFVDQDGREIVRCSRFDGIGISRLRKLGVYQMIVSTETNSVVLARAKKLGLPVVNAVEDKKTVIINACCDLGLSLNECAFLGNDINDLEVMEVVGLPVAVADAVPEILEQAVLVLEKRGGEGAVREFCDLIYGAHFKGSGSGEL